VSSVGALYKADTGIQTWGLNIYDEPIFVKSSELSTLTGTYRPTGRTRTQYAGSNGYVQHTAYDFQNAGRDSVDTSNPNQEVEVRISSYRDADGNLKYHTKWMKSSEAAGVMTGRTRALLPGAYGYVAPGTSTTTETTSNVRPVISHDQNDYDATNINQSVEIWVHDSNNTGDGHFEWVGSSELVGRDTNTYSLSGKISTLQPGSNGYQTPAAPEAPEAPAINPDEDDSHANSNTDAGDSANDKSAVHFPSGLDHNAHTMSGHDAGMIKPKFYVASGNRRRRLMLGGGAGVRTPPLTKNCFAHFYYKQQLFQNLMTYLQQVRHLHCSMFYLNRLTRLTRVYVQLRMLFCIRDTY
jgi:hypothetical protein